MSQAPVKKEVAVKHENSDSVPLDPSIGNDKYSSDDGWQEIPLKRCTNEELNDVRYHIMRFQAKQDVDIMKNFTRPVRLHRKDPRNIQFHLTREEIDKRKKEEEEAKREKEREDKEAERVAIENGEDPSTINKGEPDMSQVAPDGGARKAKKNLFKRKTRQINLMDDKKRKLRYEEYYPWVIEDYDGKNVFVGNYEAGSSDSQHVLFVFDKDGFKMVPAEKVYKFTPRNRYATLTLEEAEAKMEKNSSVPRWLMKHMEDKSASESTPDLRFRNLANRKSENPVSRKGKNMRTVIGDASTNDRDSDHDDLDFDEEFADDEEAPIMDGDEEENKLSEQKIKREMMKAAHFDGQSDAEGDDDLDDLFETEKSRKVDKEGKKLRKVLNKTEGGVYDSDEDENLNPYLSKSDLESSEDSDDEAPIKKEPEEGVMNNEQSQQTRAIFSHYVGDGFVVITAPQAFLEGFPKGSWNPNGRKRPSSNNKPVSKKSKIDDQMSNTTKNDHPRKSPSPPPLQITTDLNSAGPGNNLVTIHEVIHIIKQNKPLTTKELLLLLKSRINADKDNKQRIFSIVKQNLRLSPDGKLVLKE
ncbi:uncharacterized protein PRCAT00000549001 [Priceomyces carsonii]|uniref:uncharacterized protein n=1 Tax=Priceomyces carsonii TaxID=28549 RepID=UPI002ED904AE|nr:unnamed protein product [Priceomyces carsonii]